MNKMYKFLFGEPDFDWRERKNHKRDNRKHRREERRNKRHNRKHGRNGWKRDHRPKKQDKSEYIDWMIDEDDYLLDVWQKEME